MTFYRPHARVQFDCGDQQLTKQAHKQECDINFILSQYQRTGVLTHFNPRSPEYLNLPDDLDYQTSLNSIMDAQRSFHQLPAAVRDHYRNDPALFLAALQDPKQTDKLRELGLLKAAPKPAEASPAPEAA